jgi:tryptophan synthase alpha subunit
VSLTGITGAKLLDLADVAKNVEKIRKVTHLPVAVGFGVATPEDAGLRLLPMVVGSAIVKLIAIPRETRDGEACGRICPSLKPPARGSVQYTLGDGSTLFSLKVSARNST